MEGGAKGARAERRGGGFKAGGRGRAKSTRAGLDTSSSGAEGEAWEGSEL